MNLLQIRKLEDCFDGSLAFEYSFDHGVDEQLMKLLAGSDTLDYHPEFSRPFYKILAAAGWQIKGIVGENSMQIVFPRTDHEKKKEEFTQRLAAVLASVNF